MEQEMRVKKQITEEDSDESKPTKYKVLLGYSPVKNVAPSSQVRMIKKLTIISEDETLFEDFPHNEMVTVKISKPQRKLNE